MKSHFQVLIIGGGTAGIMVAAQLKRKQRSMSIAIIEPSADHWYQPAWTLVGPEHMILRRHGGMKPHSSPAASRGLKTPQKPSIPNSTRWPH